jgi:Bacterial Ig domain
MHAKHFILVTLLALLLSSCINRRDAMAPVITIVSPANGTTGNADNITVRGYALDDEGIRAIRVNDNDLLADANYTNERGKRLVQFAFRTGQRTDKFSANIVVEDSSGRTTTLPYELVIDTTPPILELTEVTALGNGRLRVVGIAKDNNTVQSIVIAGVTLSFIPQVEQAFNIDVPTSETMEIVVTDSAGNPVTAPLQ